MVHDIIPFAKFSSLSSFHSLYAFKDLFPGTKVGHTGVLDSFADGLMVGLIGKATKLSAYFTDCNKTYLAHFIFGCETNTLDCIGTLTATSPLPHKDKVFAAIKNFVGEQEQVPPQYSGVQVAGKRAYQFAHAGKNITLPARRITVYAIEVLQCSYDGECVKSISLKIRCSKGTYIRALCRDIAHAAQACAFVAALRRTELAGFQLSQCLWAERLPDFFEQCSAVEKKFVASGLPVVQTKAEAAKLSRSEYERYAVNFSPERAQAIGMPVLYLHEAYEKAFKLGQKIERTWFMQNDTLKNLSDARNPYAVFCHDEFLGLLRMNGNRIQYGFVF